MRSDDSPVTYGDLKKVIRFIKKLEERISESFEAIAAGDQTQSEFWDEHEDKIGRHQRALVRLSKRIDELEDGSE